MQPKIVWQQGSNNPENADNFATIRQWWASLNAKEITWRQRIIPDSGNVTELNWEPQRFDEIFLISNPEIRGITLYWQKPDSPQERSTTPHKLELDNLKQKVYIYPQSQKQLVIQVGIPEIIYQKIEMENPKLEVSSIGESKTLTFKDEQQQIEVKVTFNPQSFDQLKQQLNT